MKAFITGADGLLGSNLVREIINHGWEVRALVHPQANSATLAELDVEIVSGDLTDEKFSLAGAVKGCQYLFHCAALTDLNADPAIMYKVNVEGTRRVLDASLKSGIKRLIYISSASCFAPGTLENPGTEENGASESYRGTPYVETKSAAAELVSEYVSNKGLDAVTVAPTFMLGPYDSRPSGGEILLPFLKGKLKVASGGGRSFAYAPDVAKTILQSALSGEKGETYLAGGENLAYPDFFQKAAAVTGRPAPVITLPDFVVLAAGEIASAITAVTGKKLIINKQLARMSLVKGYYSSRKAVKQLQMPQTTVEKSIGDSVGSLVKYKHYRDDYFNGKVALITGGSRGVGYAIARDLVIRGAKVVITARGAGRLSDTAEKLETLGGEVVTVTGDVAGYRDAEKMVSAAVKKFGRLDIVVNNAGISMRGELSELSPKVCEEVVQTNLTGCINVTRAAVDHLIESGGQVIFISSIAGFMGLPGASVYCATKKALTGFAESLRIELNNHKVHAGVLYIGFTEHDPDKRIIAADGSLVLPDRPAHQTQASVAAYAVEMLRKRRRQCVLTPIGKLGWAAYRLSPAMVEKSIIWAQNSNLKIFKDFS